MTDIGVFPALPGLAWNVMKAPVFQTRIQRALSGRELRARDYPFPLWQFTLDFNFLRDNPAAGYNELRTLMGFFMLCQGAFGTFLFSDPSDHTVSGQALPPALSSVATTAIGAAGSAYTVGTTVTIVGGTAAAPATWRVISGGGGGSVTGLSLVSGGQYTVVPTNPVVTLSSGAGSGLTLNLTWLTRVQLVRTLGAAILPGGGFVEPITAPAAVSALYFNGAPQTGQTVDGATGMVTLPAPFTSAQPIITADFSYYFRCRFVNDRNDFANLMFRLWELKKLSFITVRP